LKVNPPLRSNISPPSSWCRQGESRWQVDLARFLARLILQPWKWRRYVPPKRRFNGLQGIKSQKIELFRITSVHYCAEHLLRNIYAPVFMCISTMLTYWMRSPKSLNLPRAATLNRARKSLILFPWASWKQNVWCKNGLAPFSLVLWYPEVNSFCLSFITTGLARWTGKRFAKHPSDWGYCRVTFFEITNHRGKMHSSTSCSLWINSSCGVCTFVVPPVVMDLHFEYYY
jgi:hypothetical protein